MRTAAYQSQRSRIETYFDRTAADAWARLTSDAPLGRIRATVRAGRDAMRAELLSRLPADLRGCRLLDAGCGTGALAVEAARRGAHVTAIDVAPALIKLAIERMPGDLSPGAITFRAGDMLDVKPRTFDAIVAMDSLIHYRTADSIDALAALARGTSGKLLFTFAPRTALLATMHLAGKLFPRSDRSPAIEPVSERALRKALTAHPALSRWHIAESVRIANGFYISQAMELRAP